MGTESRMGDEEDLRRTMEGAWTLDNVGWNSEEKHTGHFVPSTTSHFFPDTVVTTWLSPRNASSVASPLLSTIHAIYNLLISCEKK